MSVKVPVITVPLNDVSEDCLVVDLGTLEIGSNYYIGSPDKDYEQNLPIMDLQFVLKEICCYI